MWKIPEPLPVAYAARTRALGSAQIEIAELADGTFVQRIVHAVLPGVDRAMLLWWMHHIGDSIEWEGRPVLAYRLWHPRDHIHWSCAGPVQPGCRFHIVEAFGRERRHLVDRVFDVPKLDHGGFRIEFAIAGAARFSIDEEWEDASDGVRWTNTMRVTPRRPWLRPLVGLGRRAMQATLSAWLKHNVEEVGFIPEFLPRLYAERGASRA